MNLEPLLTATPAIQFHVLTVVAAAFLGPYLFIASKGTPRHRMLGKVWLVLMVAAAMSSFFIHEIRFWGAFSPIHLISAWVIFSAYVAIAAARRHDIRKHRAAVSSLYIGGILGAGAFALSPGRIMNQMVFGPVGPGEVHMIQNGILVAAAFSFAGRLFFSWLARRDPRKETHLPAEAEGSVYREIMD
jgi:uncharacterized membrane protein